MYPQMWDGCLNVSFSLSLLSGETLCLLEIELQWPLLGETPRTPRLSTRQTACSEALTIPQILTFLAYQFVFNGLWASKLAVNIKNSYFQSKEK